MVSVRSHLNVVVVIVLALFGSGFIRHSIAQIITVGAGALVSDRAPEAVAEVTAMTAPVSGVRAFTTGSWTDNEWQPTVITALDYAIPVARPPLLSTGPGLLWLHVNDYRPYPIWQGTMIVPLGKSRFNMVAIGSTQPFQRFEWSLVLKVAVTALFKR